MECGKNYANAEFEQARHAQDSRRRLQERKALEQEKERLEREHEEQWSALCRQVVQEAPAFVEEDAQHLGTDAPFLRRRYDSGQRALARIIHQPEKSTREGTFGPR